MSYWSRSRAYESQWPEYVPVAERRRRAMLEMEKLRKKGQTVSPVTLESKKIATTFWGKAWCDNLEGYADFSNRIGRGRTYVRNGSVVDLQIAPREVTAIVSGSSLYKIKIDIDEVPKSQWSTICRECAGGIDSLVELLQGRFSTGVMERICRPADGLFPKPAEIRFKCSCPDWAYMCKHVAAVLYGVGARLDQRPELLFHLRAVDQNELVARIDTSVPLAKDSPAAGKVLDGDDLSALFGLELDGAGTDETAGAPPVPAKAAKTGARKVAAKPRRAAAAKGASNIEPSGKRAPAKPSAQRDVVAPPPAARTARPAERKAAKGAAAGAKGSSGAPSATKRSPRRGVAPVTPADGQTLGAKRKSVGNGAATSRAPSPAKPAAKRRPLTRAPAKSAVGALDDGANSARSNRPGSREGRSAKQLGAGRITP